jgi:hypothetical protein
MADHLRADLIWGVEAIASEIGRTPRQAYHLLQSGALPVAKKVGGHWVVQRRKLEAFFAGEDQAA